MLKGLALGGRGNKAALVLALLLGALAAVLTAVYLSNAGDEGGGSITAEGVPTVVAAQDIAAGTRIEANMVRIRSLPKDVALPGAFAASEDVVGKVAVADIVSGEQIVPSRVVATTSSGQAITASSLAETVPLQKDAATCRTDRCGQRAVSVAVAPTTASGGQIRPGDRVDVVLAFQDGSAITILQDIEVLSIDQELVKVITAEDQQRQKVATGEAKPEAETATLAVWPEEAQILAAGEEFVESHRMKILSTAAASALGIPVESEFDCEGDVRLVLRPVGQNGPVKLQTRGLCASAFAYIWGLQ